MEDLVVTADGSAVSLWDEIPTGGFTRSLYAAVRPAGSDTWGEPHLLATTPTEEGDVKLLASADGGVTALWTDFPNLTGPGAGSRELRLVSAVLSADGSWSEPVEIAGTDEGVTSGGIDLAEGPDGTVTAVWSTQATWDAKREVRVADRVDGTWSAPRQVSTVAKDGAAGAIQPQVAVDTHGGTVIAYLQQDGEGRPTVRTVTRPAPTGTWGAPVVVTGAAESASSPRLSAARDGSVTMVWASFGASGSDSATIYASRRASSAAGWGTAEPVSSTDDLVETPEPLVGPNGDVTLVWVDRPTTFSTRTATRSAAKGTWSAPRTLSTGYVSEQYDASVGADGTVRAIWTQANAKDTQRALLESSLSGGVWSKAGQLPGSCGRVRERTGRGIRRRQRLRRVVGLQRERHEAVRIPHPVVSARRQRLHCAVDRCPQGHDVLQQGVEALLEAEPSGLLVVGHAHRSGKPDRAHAVRHHRR